MAVCSIVLAGLYWSRYASAMNLQSYKASKTKSGHLNIIEYNNDCFKNGIYIPTGEWLVTVGNLVKIIELCDGDQDCLD